ncbi:16S rRNA (cytosine(1402)-N(4))-methyltransferase RsmH [Patescibacteria group bacterium]|nr:16S rRNA (cytosine(1402)-N(4))-methyltransferase RsmH [Patescibacteria group bacterium]
MTKIKHIPVMLIETIRALDIKPDQWYVDATFGQGGHSREILNRGAKVVAFDYDQNNIEANQDTFALEIKAKSLILIRENFAQLERIISELDLSIAGILFDFGTTSEQLLSTDRGISFEGEDQELDMRLDDRLGVKARDLLAVLGEKQLQKILEVFGGEREAKKITRTIIKKRRAGEFITTVGQLVKLVRDTKTHRPSRIHPATKVFQALRIAVNDELSSIDRALPQAIKILKPGGKIITIAFHQGDDRIVKNYFREWERVNKGQQLTKKVIKPTAEEISNNPGARSSRMRIFEKNK